MFDRSPRCGETLKPGFVSAAGRNILWTPSSRFRISNLPMEKGEFSLPGEGFWRGAMCPAQYCEHCGLILIETKEEESN